MCVHNKQNHLYALLLYDKRFIKYLTVYLFFIKMPNYTCAEIQSKKKQLDHNTTLSVGLENVSLSDRGDKITNKMDYY